ncbi:peroxide stress protein YaaA, partial [Clostridioides difficile]|uniref:peroxide stress protein YaaA n=1 Tax=Clostridioides difficile TaxID=1496 RepID=UPI003F8D6946
MFYWTNIYNVFWRVWNISCIRIISGLYGVVKPYDSIYEYRLEMQTKLQVGEFKNLYEYW